MRLLMFRSGAEADSLRRPGALRPGQEDEVVDLGDAWPDLLALVEAGEKGLAAAAEAIARPRAVIRPLEAVSVLAPLDPPRCNVIAVGRNYREHAEETARARGEALSPPTVFTKAITSITGPYDPVPVDPDVSELIDWEAELAFVIGRRGLNVPREDALSHVFGYTVLNDVSARDLQYGWGGQFFKGKSLDGSCPTGPWLVTRDEVPDPQALAIRLRVNGEVKQEASTAGMIYPVADLVAWLSKGMTLLPGTLVATGTPPGVGSARTPPEFLRPGDVMETEVEGVGLMRNPVVRAGVGSLA